MTMNDKGFNPHIISNLLHVKGVTKKDNAHPTELTLSPPVTKMEGKPKHRTPGGAGHDITARKHWRV